MIIESLATYLESEGIGTVNNDIFIGELPYDTDNCIALISGQSPDSNYSLDIYEQSVDVYGRFKNSEAGYSLMMNIFNLLHKGQNYEIPGFHIYFSNARGMVNDNDRDASHRKLYQSTYRFIFRQNSS